MTNNKREIKRAIKTLQDVCQANQHNCPNCPLAQKDGEPGKYLCLFDEWPREVVFDDEYFK